MSRRYLDARPDADATKVTLGWDDLNNTYYVQVWDYRIDPVGHLVLERGDPNEIHDPEVVLTIARRYADLPDDLADQLTAEQAAEGRSHGKRAAGDAGTPVA